MCTIWKIVLTLHIKFADLALLARGERKMMDRDTRKKLEFRKVLGRVSDGLGGENVTALKNLCYDMIAERKREGIDSGIAIFNALIEESKSIKNVSA